MQKIDKIHEQLTAHNMPDIVSRSKKYSITVNIRVRGNSAPFFKIWRWK
jgi:hypothetical protein